MILTWKLIQNYNLFNNVADLLFLHLVSYPNLSGLAIEHIFIFSRTILSKLLLLPYLVIWMSATRFHNQPNLKHRAMDHLAAVCISINLTKQNPIISHGRSGS